MSFAHSRKPMMSRVKDSISSHRAVTNINNAILLDPGVYNRLTKLPNLLAVKFKFVRADQSIKRFYVTPQRCTNTFQQLEFPFGVKVVFKPVLCVNLSQENLGPLEIFTKWKRATPTFPIGKSGAVNCGNVPASGFVFALVKIRRKFSFIHNHDYTNWQRDWQHKTEVSEGKKRGRGAVVAPKKEAP